MEALRDVVVSRLIEAAGVDHSIIAVDCDMGPHTRLDRFASAYPDRAYQAGVSEQHAIGLAAGLASCGARPVVASFAAFVPGRCWEQIRHSVALPNLPVIMIGTHTSFSGGEDGASHQSFEDIALTRMLPNMRVFAPADPDEARAMTDLALTAPGPSYLRMGRSPVRRIPACARFQVGEPCVVFAPGEVVLISTGEATQRCIDAAIQLLPELRLGVIHLGCLKPVDTERLADLLLGVRHVVAVEDHFSSGGLGSLVAQSLLSRSMNARFTHYCVPDVFGQSGSEEALLCHYRLDAKSIAERLRTDVLRRMTAQ